MAAALSIRRKILVITLTARETWGRPGGWWGLSGNAGKGVPLRMPWECRSLPEGLCLPGWAGLGPPETHALCVLLTWETYN